MIMNKNYEELFTLISVYRKDNFPLINLYISFRNIPVSQTHSIEGFSFPSFLFNVVINYDDRLCAIIIIQLHSGNHLLVLNCHIILIQQVLTSIYL